MPTNITVAYVFVFWREGEGFFFWKRGTGPRYCPGALNLCWAYCAISLKLTSLLVVYPSRVRASHRTWYAIDAYCVNHSPSKKLESLSANRFSYVKVCWENSVFLLQSLQRSRGSYQHFLIRLGIGFYETADTSCFIHKRKKKVFP